MKNRFTKCRVLGNKIPIIIDFGRMPFANGFSKSTKNNSIFSMKAAFNEKNGLFQLTEVPPKKKMFNNNYAFLSSTSNYMKAHFEKLSKKIKKSFLRNKKDIILEIGCNDGIFLENFKKFNHIGIEPSKNVFNIAKRKKIKVINKFFNLQTLLDNSLLNNVKVIYAANVICHIADIKELFQNISFALKDDGVFIFEEPYLGDMVEKVSYDQIYDEHCYIFSILSISNLGKLFNLEVFHAERTKTHGGSMRYYLSHSKKKIKTKSLKKLISYESKKNLGDLKTMKIFSNKCFKSRKDLKNKIQKIKSKNNKIYGYGATSKSTTILNFCKINNKHIDGIFDNSKTKINKFTPNTRIKIIDYKYFNNFKPKYCFLFAWNHFKEIFNKEKNKKIIWITHIDKKFFPSKYKKEIL